MKSRRAALLGELEKAVLDHLWSAGPRDAKAMHAALGRERGIALNTVQSTLERLVRKGLAERRKQGRAYSYAAAVSRTDWVAGAVQHLIADIPGLGPHVLLAAFVELAERAGSEELALLERLVAERRRGGRCS
jgi:predicted transcriptional regulator